MEILILVVALAGYVAALLIAAAPFGFLERLGLRRRIGLAAAVTFATAPFVSAPFWLQLSGIETMERALSTLPSLTIVLLVVVVLTRARLVWCTALAAVVAMITSAAFVAAGLANAWSIWIVSGAILYAAIASGQAFYAFRYSK